MAFEKQIPAVEPRQLTSDGGTLGQIQIADTRGYKVGAKAVIVAVSQPDLNVQIKRVMSETLMLVGPIGSTYFKAEWTNVAAYTVAAGAYIYAQAQEKANVPANDRDDATYDQEPTVAWRNVLVDQLGRYYETANPLPVRLTNGSVNIGTVNADIEVQLSHSKAVADSVRIGDGVEEWQMNTTGEGLVHDQDTHDKLDASNSSLALVQANLDTIITHVDGLEALLATIGNNTDQLEGFTDGIEGLVAATNALLTTIRDNADTLETLAASIDTKLDTVNTNLTTMNTDLKAKSDILAGLLVTIRDNADTLETLIASTNVKLDTLNSTLQTEFDETQVKQDVGNASVASIDLKVSTEATLLLVKANLDTIITHVDGLEGFTDGLEGLATSTNALLTTVRDNADTVETLLANLGSNTDDIEALISSTNSLLTTVRDNADTVESLLTALGTNTDQLEGFVDGVEGLITSTNSLLTTIRDNADTLENLIASTNVKLDTLNSTLQTEFDETQVKQDTGNSSLASIDSKVATQTTLALVQARLETIITHVDGVEALLSDIGNNTDGLEGFTDGIEGLVTASNALLTTIRDNADQLEGFTDGVEGLLTTIRDNADTLETLVASTNTELNTANTNLTTMNTDLKAKSDVLAGLLVTIRDNADTLETLIASTNTKIDELKTLTQTEFDETQVKQDTGNSSLASIDTKVATQSTLALVQARLETIITHVDGVEGLLTDIGNNTDGLEGFTDGIEGLVTASNALLTTIRDNADQLEGFTDGVEGLLTTIRDNADTLEALTTSQNTKIDSSNTKLDELITLTQTEFDQTQVKQDTGNVSLASIDVKMVISSSPAPALNTDTLVVRPLPYEPQTYSASAVAFVPAAAATDIFTLAGSATRVIRIHKIRVTASTTSGAGIRTTFNLIRRSTLNTGGTRVAGTAGRHDSNNAAATANPGHFTANPTVLGTLVAVIRSTHVSTRQEGIYGGDVEWNFELMGQPLILRGTNENISVNLNGGTITGPIVSISIEWSEV